MVQHTHSLEVYFCQIDIMCDLGLELIKLFFFRFIVECYCILGNFFFCSFFDGAVFLKVFIVLVCTGL